MRAKAHGARNVVRLEGAEEMGVSRQRVARKSLLYDELRRILAERLEGYPEALKLAEELVAAYERGGSRALRERLREILKEV
ncbi:MAG: hypothetical protein DRK00_05785, partial [Thermoprotei archaeon]